MANNTIKHNSLKKSIAPNMLNLSTDLLLKIIHMSWNYESLLVFIFDVRRCAEETDDDNDDDGDDNDK